MQSSWQDPPPPSSGSAGGDMQFAMPRVTPMVKLLLLANAAVFLLTFFVYFVNTQAWTGGADGIGLIDILGVQPMLWRDWFPFLPIWQLVTYGFCHSATGLMHILMNMLFLFFLGSLLEGIVGARRFLTLYMTSVVLAGLSMLILGLALGDSIPTVGASGAVFAIVVAAAVLRPQTRIIFIIFPITLRTLAIIYVGFSVFGTLMSLKGQSTGVADLAHLTGAAWGFAVAKTGWIWRDPFEDLEEWKKRRGARRRAYDTERLDQLLVKIDREGINSLSSAEKAFLKRTAKR